MFFRDDHHEPGDVGGSEVARHARLSWLVNAGHALHASRDLAEGLEASGRSHAELAVLRQRIEDALIEVEDLLAKSEGG